MPANGDNKPKLQKMFDKAIAATNTDTNIGFMLATIAMLLIVSSLFILFVCAEKWYYDQPVEGGYVLVTILIMVISGAYLRSKLK